MTRDVDHAAHHQGHQMVAQAALVLDEARHSTPIGSDAQRRHQTDDADGDVLLGARQQRGLAGLARVRGAHRRAQSRR